MKLSPKNMYYKVLVPAVVVLSCITFTPLVIPYGIRKPTLFSFPYTLWTGLIIALLFVILTTLATRFHPGEKEDES